MPNPTSRMLLSTKIRELINRDERTVNQIADEAKVDRLTLWRWLNHKTKKLDVDQADQVFETLTGEPLD